jgi:hypothetical protein
VSFGAHEKGRNGGGGRRAYEVLDGRENLVAEEIEHAKATRVREGIDESHAPPHHSTYEDGMLSGW